ncbi:MAG TPA: hypothetical protein VMB21_09245 [Candidatus Limnocylindria bacterium]|nr:hypothetical protein [Candidatus Limnocylindria bacterium]
MSAAVPNRKRGADAWLLGLLGLLGLLAGCAGPELPPVNLAAPGWHVSEAPAVWRPKRAAPELIGELLVATNPDGSRLVQFSKQSLPLITAQVATNGWNISSPLRSGRFGGTHTPTTRVPWFQITELPPTHDPVSPPWQLHTETNGAWKLTNGRTGESLEGVAP